MLGEIFFGETKGPPTSLPSPFPCVSVSRPRRQRFTKARRALSSRSHPLPPPPTQSSWETPLGASACLGVGAGSDVRAGRSGPVGFRTAGPAGSPDVTLDRPRASPGSDVREAPHPSALSGYASGPSPYPPRERNQSETSPAGSGGLESRRQRGRPPILPPPSSLRIRWAQTDVRSKEGRGRTVWEAGWCVFPSLRGSRETNLRASVTLGGGGPKHIGSARHSYSHDET